MAIDHLESMYHMVVYSCYSSFHNNMVVHSFFHVPSETCTGKSNFSIIFQCFFSRHVVFLSVTGMFPSLAKLAFN